MSVFKTRQLQNTQVRIILYSIPCNLSVHNMGWCVNLFVGLASGSNDGTANYSNIRSYDSVCFHSDSQVSWCMLYANCIVFAY